jgi:hypothetical protein
MLTGGSVIFMEGSSTQVVCGMLVAMLAIHVYSVCAPFIKHDDDLLALAAQWCICFTLFGGLLLKLHLNTSDGYDENGSGFGVFLILINVTVLVVGVAAAIYCIYSLEIMKNLRALQKALVRKLGLDDEATNQHPTKGSREVEMTTNPAFASATEAPDVAALGFV